MPHLIFKFYSISKSFLSTPPRTFGGHTITSPMRTLPTAEEAHELTSDVHPILVQCFRDGLRSASALFDGDIGRGMLINTPAWKAQAMHHYTWNHMNMTLGASAGIRLLPNEASSFVVLCHDALLLWPKKVKLINDKLVSSNYRTPRAVAMRNNSTGVLRLPLDPCVVTLGCMVSDTWTTVQGVWMICESGGEEVWKIDIMNQAIGTAVIPFAASWTDTPSEPVLRVKEAIELRRQQNK